MKPTRLFERLGLLGVVYAVLFGLANILFGNGPSAKKSGAAVVKYYTDHKASVIAGVFVLALATVAFTFFLSSLRHALARTEDGRHLSSVVIGGGAVYVSGLLLMAALSVALVDAGHQNMSGVAQTLNVLSSDSWVPVVAGLAMVALGTGISALRTGALPAWLAWASIGLGVLSLAGPLGGIAFLITPLWALVVGVVLFRARAVADPSVPASPSSRLIPAGD
jgi:hypothetical protein